MREYFFTCLLFATTWLSTVFFISVLITVYFIRHYFLKCFNFVKTLLEKPKKEAPPKKKK